MAALAGPLVKAGAPPAPSSYPRWSTSVSTAAKDLRPALERMLRSEECYILDVMVPYTEHVLPMIPSGKTYKDIIIDERHGKFEG